MSLKAILSHFDLTFHTWGNMAGYGMWLAHVALKSSDLGRIIWQYQVNTPEKVK